LVVRLENIGMRYDAGGDVLSGVTLALQPGEFCFLTGASGAGKTTLLKIVYLAERPSRGSVTLFGADAATGGRSARAVLRRRIGVVFQECRLVDHLSVGDNVALPLRIARVPEGEIRDHVPELLGWLGMRHRIEARPPLLSEGERQRVAVARAIVRRPELLIADEPTCRGDEEVAMLLVRAFEHMNRLGTTVLIATHDLGFVRQFEHRRVHLEKGSLVDIGGDTA
jgi:cell division transport system ATP-binding protein